MTMKEIAVVLFLVMTPSATNEEMINLTCVSGNNITLSHPVKERGFLSLISKNSTKIIAKVFRGEMEIEDEEFQNRIFWDNVTGLFTVTILQEDNPKQINVESKENGSHIVSYNLILVNESFSAADQKNTSNNCCCFNLLDILKISFPIRCLIKSWGCSAEERFYCVLSNVLIVIIIIVPIIFIIWCCRKKKNSTSDTQEQKCCCEVVKDFLKRCNKEEKHDDTEMKPLSTTTQVATAPEAPEQDVSSQQVKYLQLGVL